MKPQIRERLAALHIEIDETASQRHLAAVTSELRDPVQPARYRQTHRIKVGTLVAVALLLLLPGAALAAEGAVPGDLLYPIKRATERVLLLIDPNIEAEHRIEELEMLIDRAVPFEEVSDRLIDADRLVEDRDVPDDLLDRLVVVRDRVTVDYDQRRVVPVHEGGDDPTEDDRPEDDVRSEERRPATTMTSTTTSTTAIPQKADRPPPPDSTTTAPPQADRPGSDATTTTSPPRSRDDRSRDS